MTYIIGIGGIRASGKSTIARNLGLIIRADIISTGRTREMLRAQLEYAKFPEFYASINDTDSIEETVKYLKLQAEKLKPSIKAAIKQCWERDASLIVEGTHVYLGLYDKDDFDIEVLASAPEEKIRHRIHKDKKRRFSEKAIQRSLELQDYLTSLANEHKIPIIDTTSIPNALIEIVRFLPTDRKITTYYDLE